LNDTALAPPDPLDDTSAQRAPQPDAVPPAAAVPPDPPDPQRTPLIQPESPQRAPPADDPLPASPLEYAPPVTPVRRNPCRVRQVPQRYRTQHGFLVVKTYCRAMAGALLLSQTGQAYDSCYLLNLLLDHDFGLYENLGPDTLMLAPHAMKASTTPDPRTPRIHG
jgi:hypothetical protein